MKQSPILAALCCAFGLIVSSGSRQNAIGAEKPDKVRFTYAPLSASGFLWFIAKDAGYFEKNRLDVDMYFEGASPIMVQSILAGDNQLAGGLGPTVVTNVLQGGDVIRSPVSLTRLPPRYTSNRRSPACNSCAARKSGSAESAPCPT